MERCQWLVTAATATSLITIREAVAQEPARLPCVSPFTTRGCAVDVLESARNRAAAAFEKAGVDVDGRRP